MMFIRGFRFRILLMIFPLGLPYRTVHPWGSSCPQPSLHDRPKRLTHRSPLCLSSVDVSSGSPAAAGKAENSVLGKSRFDTAIVHVGTPSNILEVGPHFFVAYAATTADAVRPWATLPRRIRRSTTTMPKGRKRAIKAATADEVEVIFSRPVSVEPPIASTRRQDDVLPLSVNGVH